MADITAKMTQCWNFKFKPYIYERKKSQSFMYTSAVIRFIPISVLLLTKLNKSFRDDIYFTYSLEWIKCDVGMWTTHSTGVIILDILLEFINIWHIQCQPHTQFIKAAFNSNVNYTLSYISCDWSNSAFLL
jgi:hypothetical protein